VKCVARIGDNVSSIRVRVKRLRWQARRNTSAS